MPSKVRRQTSVSVGAELEPRAVWQVAVVPPTSSQSPAMPPPPAVVKQPLACAQLRHAAERDARHAVVLLVSQAAATPLSTPASAAPASTAAASEAASLTLSGAASSTVATSGVAPSAT